MQPDIATYPIFSGQKGAFCNCTDQMYDGEFCDHYICANFCQNGGMCFPLTFSKGQKPLLVCSCRAGFEGPRCNINSSSCQSKCANNSTCQIQNGQAKCLCAKGFLGVNCDRCASNEVCQNGGRCVFGKCKKIGVQSGLSIWRTERSGVVT